MSTLTTLHDLLKERAENAQTGCLYLYPLGKASSPPRKVNYSELYTTATYYGERLRTLSDFTSCSPVLIILQDHWETILWFWAVLFAGGIPTLGPAPSDVEAQRKTQLKHLSTLLESPLCLTNEENLALLSCGEHNLKLHSVQSLQTLSLAPTAGRKRARGQSGEEQNVATLMLTSGSTGQAKATVLLHEQMIRSVQGKASIRPRESNTFLNWVGLDHVAGLLEIHLQALWLAADQVHVSAADAVASPSLFLDLLSRHRVTRTFAPNFFLRKLVATCSADTLTPVSRWDLSNLTFFVTGGEANDIQTCTATAALLARYGAPPNVIAPGFGMTETCAGAIYSLDCPECDISQGRTIACLGRCMPGIEARISIAPKEGERGIRMASQGETGDLEVRGAVVFRSYYRDHASTKKAFTADGWFRTGDQAKFDSKGTLNLMGRVKDVVNINGIKIPMADIQASVEASITETVVSRIICFPSREQGAATEQITIAYIPKWQPEPSEMAEVQRLSTEACALITTASQPLVFAITTDSLPFVPISTLGKIAGSKMRALVEAGVFRKDIEQHKRAVLEAKQSKLGISGLALSADETLIQEDFAYILGSKEPKSLNPDAPILELGFTSVDLIKLKHRIDERLGIHSSIILFLKNNTIRRLASALSNCQNIKSSGSKPPDAVPLAVSNPDETGYDPVVKLHPSGSKTPLWLVHPGIGEVLVFIGLTRHLEGDDRPVYALRARGFEPDQTKFTSIRETVDTYIEAVRRVQPKGPYALAGYSYGTMIAFEMAKSIKSTFGEQVRFLGSFNLPPHIKTRMRQLNWVMCLIHLAQFLDLVPDTWVEKIATDPHSSYHKATRSKAIAHIISQADPSRLQELGLNAEGLLRWSDIAYGLQSMAVDYEPSGRVDTIDVFYAEPLKVAAASREEWVEEHLRKWQDFCQTEPAFHHVGGSHYTMIGSNHVTAFSKTLREALRKRGV